jgi:hypothetical protein
VLIALVILGLVVPAVFFITRNMSQQAANVGGTVQGVQQDQTAGEALYPYLQAATAVLNDSTGDMLDAEIYWGFDKVDAIPNTAELTVTLNPPPGCAPGTCYGKQTTLTATLAPAGLGTYAQQHATTVGTFYALYEPDVFTYLYNTSLHPSGVSGVTNPQAFFGGPSTTMAGQVQLSQIVEVEVNITFLAGPDQPIVGYSQIEKSHFNTTVYLENAAGSKAKQTYLTLISPGTITYGSSTSYLQAVISPGQVSVGTVEFSVYLPSSMAQPVVECPAAHVFEGIATCPFNSPGWGGGTAMAVYQPPADNPEYLPSQQVSISIESFVPTTLSFGTVGTARGGPPTYVTVPVTVSDAVAGGPAVPASGNMVFSYYFCSGPGSSTTSSSSSTTSTTTATGLSCGTLAAGPYTDCLPCGTSPTGPTWTDKSWSNSGNFPLLGVPTSGSTIQIEVTYGGFSYFAPSSVISQTFSLY